MKLDYYKDPVGNFGDDLNAFIWDNVWPDYQQYTKADWLVGIGSIFTGRLDQLPGTKLIMGSGYWPTEDGKPDLEKCRIGFVRGPHTCRALGIDEKYALADTAVLIANEITRPSKLDERVGFIPHHTTCAVFDCNRIAEMAGLRFVDPTRPPMEVLDDILEAPMVLAEAMHGAIVADAVGVPWQRVSLFDRRLGRRERVDFKWQDWGASLDLDTTPIIEHILPWPGRNTLRRIIKKPYLEWNLRQVAAKLSNMAKNGKYKLSKRDLLRAKIEQIQERVGSFKC